jgi:hypothetical protein
MGYPCCGIYDYISGHAAVDRLAQQISKGQFRLLAATIIGQVVGDQPAQAEPFI